MNLFASLSTLAVVGYAQTATFTSKDIYGNILDTQTVEGAVGETFEATLNLGAAPKDLSLIELGVSTYGVWECDFYMEKREGRKYIGSFYDMCDWPNVSTEGDNFLGRFSVRDLNQFKQHALLTVKCPIKKTTIADRPPVGCELNRPSNLHNDEVKDKVFDFQPVFRTKKAYKKEAAFIWLTQFGKIFLGGANPALDLWLDMHNWIVFKKQFKATFAADGFRTGKKLQGGDHSKGGHSHGHSHVDTEQFNADWSQQGQFYNQLNRFLKKGASIYGITTFGVQTIADLYVMVQTYKGAGAMSAEENLEAVNETIFTWNKDNWHFYQLINGNKESNATFYKELQFWYYAQAAIQETMGFYQMLNYDTYYIPATIPRLFKSYWELGAIGFMTTSA